jgi:hypothetical protein
MNWGKASAFLPTLTLLASIFSSISQAQQLDLPSIQYRVKFICGPSDGKILALGNYFTAINLHNPSDQPPPPAGKNNGFRMKVAVALRGEGTAGHSEFVGFFDVTSDDATEIDCQEILGRAVQDGKKLCPFEPAGFCNGFVIIESRTELDVVAVYSAADLNTHQVTTLHTDRVPPHFLGSLPQQ